MDIMIDQGQIQGLLNRLICLATSSTSSSSSSSSTTTTTTAVTASTTTGTTNDNFMKLYFETTNLVYCEKSINIEKKRFIKNKKYDTFFKSTQQQHQQHSQHQSTAPYNTNQQHSTTVISNSNQQQQSTKATAITKVNNS
ncbi:hypothetical protein ACTA71_004906 [Dictyostelium dimigraforme]